LSAAFEHEKAGERAQSIGLREKACALGQAAACESIERLLRGGALDPARREALVAAQARGRRLAEQTCDRGDWIACVDLARLNKKSPNLAQAFSQRACDAGLADGCAVLSDLYAGSSEPGAEERELEYLRRACELDAPESCAAAARLEVVRADDETPRGAAEARASRLREAEVLQRRAFELRRHSCDLDNGDDCFELAKMHAAGEGTSKDEALAKQIAGRALGLLAAQCEREQKLDASCISAGDGYASRRWGLLDGSRVAALYQLACAQDEAIECKFAADLYREGSLVPRDDERARSLFAKACGLGDLDACTTGEVMTKDLPASDPYRERLKAARSRERPRLRDACADGNLLRCLELGRDLEGDDPAQATAMYQRACDADGAMCYHLGASLAKAHPEQALAAFTRDCKGFGPACERAAELASKLHKSELVVPLRQRAVEFLRRGCRHGNSSNCFKLAKPPRKPEEPAPDPAFARRAAKLGLHFAEIACDRGETSECGDAADVLMKTPDDRDPKRAAALYAKGCQWGEASACSSLADMLHHGDGVKPDEKRADELYQQACKLGEESSCNPHPEEDESDGD
jgi:TPR repeat protein